MLQWLNDEKVKYFLVIFYFSFDGSEKICGIATPVGFVLSVPRAGRMFVISASSLLMYRHCMWCFVLEGRKIFFSQLPWYIKATTSFRNETCMIRIHRRQNKRWAKAVLTCLSWNIGTKKKKNWWAIDWIGPSLSSQTFILHNADNVAHTVPIYFACTKNQFFLFAYRFIAGGIFWKKGEGGVSRVLSPWLYACNR